MQANLTPKEVGLSSIPAELKRKFVSDRGGFLLQIHPRVDIWEREGASRFVRDLRGIDPEVTGTPIITYEAITLMERAYKQGTLYAVLLVTGVTLVMLRRVRETALALLPLALGLIWTGGLMALFGLDFNMGNIFGLPLILGAAVEYGLNVVLRYMETRREPGAPLIARSTVMGVLVAGLTNIVGFGSLMLADHRGIFGLGLLLTLGTAASLVAALVVLPVLLQMIRPDAAGAHADRGPRRARPRRRRIGNPVSWGASNGPPKPPALVAPRGTRGAPRCRTTRFPDARRPGAVLDVRRPGFSMPGDRGDPRSRLEHQVAAQDGHRLAAQANAVAGETHAHHAAPRGGLVADQLALAEALAPERPQRAVRGSRDGILVDARARGEEARDEVPRGRRPSGW